MGNNCCSDFTSTDKEAKNLSSKDVIQVRSENNLENKTEKETEKESDKITDGEKPKKNVRHIQATDLVGEKHTKISKEYEFLSEIGSGAFSKAYKVKHIATGIFRCVKKLAKKELDEKEQAALQSEVGILKTLQHSNILKVQEFYQNQNYFFIVTELLNGGELFDRIQSLSYFDEKSAAKVMQQLIRAVSYLHKNGLTHRDLKPENIVYETNDEDSNIKLIDFGTATKYDPSDEKNLNARLGTAYYIAPEVLKQDYDNRCDIWSAGVIMYILLCGSPPFNADKDKDIMKKIQIGKFNFPSKDWDSISIEAKDLIKKMQTYDYHVRINCDEVLKHPWFEKMAKQKDDKVSRQNTDNVLSNMKKFSTDCKFQEAILLYVVHFFELKDEKENILKTFEKLDLNGDGQITREELYEGYVEKMGHEDAKKEVDIMFGKIDINGDNAIDVNEFCLATIDHKKVLNEEKMTTIFKMIDTDSSGQIDLNELKVFFGMSDKNDGDEIIRDLIGEADENSDGQISLKEFKTMMSRIYDKL